MDGSTTDTNTPGEDAAPEIDAPPAACGDGHRDPGETCYGTPISLDGGDNAYEAQLADIDGDGDLDLAFVAGQLLFFTQQGGTFATTPSNGPAVPGIKFRAVNLGGDARLELISGGVGAISTWQTSGTSTAYTSTSAATEPTFKPVGIELAKITNGALPEVVSSYGDKIFVGTYNTSMVLTNVSNRSVVKTTGFAVGSLDADNFADVAVAGSEGIVVFRGTATGLDTLIDTPHDAAVSAVAIADIDGDGTSDIVFSKSGTAGSIGWMRGLGNTTFATPQIKSVPNFAIDIVATDIDGDGRSDVIGGRPRGTLAVLVFHGNADGTLADPVELPYPFSTMTSLSAADYNGDSVADIVVSVASTGEIVIYPSTP